MNSQQIIRFIAIMIPFAALPGPGVLASLSYGLRQQSLPSALLILGISLGDCIYLVLSVLGAARLIHSFPHSLLVMKIIGAVFLTIIGLRMYLVSAKNQPSIYDNKQEKPINALWTGLSISLSNPKVMLFYLGLLPVVLDLDSISPSSVGNLIFLILIILWIILGIYNITALKVSRFLIHPSNPGLINKAGGMILLICAVLLIVR